MTALVLVQTVMMTVFLWTSGSGQILSEERRVILYPKIGESETIVCESRSLSCNEVFWFRISLHNHTLQFLVSSNNAGRGQHGADVDKNRFKVDKRSSKSFSLRIHNITIQDEGIYSCILKASQQEELWSPGVLLLPGETPPTVAPVVRPKKPVRPACSCTKKYPHGGCGSLVLWPLVGILLGLAVALISTLYYFSRLPKKCPHHFMKKRQMR